MRRRGLLKLIGALGALALPFTLWPSRVINALENMARPDVKLELPPKPEAKAEAADPAREALNRTALDDIEYLASPLLEGRRTGTKGEELASIYLQEQMSYLGLIPFGHNQSTFVQPFTVLSYQERIVNNRLTLKPLPGEYLKSAGINLIGGIAGAEDEYVIISAHYDHLGIYNGKIYPGANDNASGVGTVLDVTRRIVSEGLQLKRTLLIAFWSAEEVGFLGSKAFISNPTVPLSKIKAVFNVDTVANGKTGDLCLWCVGEHLALTTIRDAAKPFGVSLSAVSPNGHNSDHISFAQAGIPAITLLARDWLNNNHSPEDTPQRINPDQLKLATDIVYQAVKQLVL